jgi:hypothetical protein
MNPRRISLILMLASGTVGGIAPVSSAPAGPFGAALKAGAYRGGAKPTAPIRIDVQPGRTTGKGRQWVRVVVRATLDAPRLEVRVDADDGLTIVSGPRAWTSRGSRGAATSEGLLLAESGPGSRRLRVIARLGSPETGWQTGVAVYELNPSELKSPPLPSGGRRVPGPDGRQLREIPSG